MILPPKDPTHTLKSLIESAEALQWTALKKWLEESCDSTLYTFTRITKSPQGKEN